MTWRRTSLCRLRCDFLFYDLIISSKRFTLWWYMTLTIPNAYCLVNVRPCNKHFLTPNVYNVFNVRVYNQRKASFHSISMLNMSYEFSIRAGSHTISPFPSTTITWGTGHIIFSPSSDHQSIWCELTIPTGHHVPCTLWNTLHTGQEIRRLSNLFSSNSVFTPCVNHMGF